MTMRHKARFVTPSRGPSGPVGQRLRRLSEWAVASCFSAALGCGAEAGAGKLQLPLTPGPGPVKLVACGDLLLATDPINPAVELDYIGLYRQLWQSSPDYVTVLSDHGEVCLGAPDQDACLADVVTRLASPPSCATDATFCRPFVITTHGGEVKRYDTPEELARVLGRVDTASEAVLLAQLHGLNAACSGSDVNSLAGSLGTLVQATGAGFRVQSKWTSCAGNGGQSIEIFEDGTSPGFERDERKPQNCGTTGRRPAGLQPSAAARVRECKPLGAFLAEQARLEAASVPAFQRLASELHRLGAVQLAVAARRSARDEVRHTELVRRLAQRWGARMVAPRVAAARCARTPFEIAHENAVEGCVRETFGALVAWQQSLRARDPLVARTMRSIAADETRHAQLSWQVASFIEPKLSARECLALDRARSAALEQLHRELADDLLPSTSAAHIGWPSRAQQAGLLNRLAAEL